MRSLKAIFRLQSWERLFNNVIASILFVGMMLLVVSDVGGRYIFKRAVPGTLEITEFIMVALVYFTLAHTQAIKGHIKVEFLLALMSRTKRLILELITYLLGLMVFALVTWQVWMSFIDSWQIREETVGQIPFPIYPAKLTIPIGCFLLCLRFAVDLARVLKELTRKDVP